MDVKIRSRIFGCARRADQNEISLIFDRFFFDFSFFAKNLDFGDENGKIDLGREIICQNAPRIRILHEKLYRFARFSASNSVSNPFS